MANTIDFILTNAASELISKVLSGKTLNFTRMAVGDGFSYDLTVAKDYTALVNEVLSIDITKKETLSASSVKITSAFKNTDAQKEFYYREVGLFAQDPDTGEEVLYAYGNRNDAAELITPSGSSVVTKQLVFIIAVGDSANVTFNVNADVYALQEDMLNVQENKADKNLANTGMITNCLIEVPQRIKYDIADGNITIYAGSVIVVPYGTQAPTYSIGDSFGTNFTVVDIQYDVENPKLFYWLKMNENITESKAESDSFGTLLIKVSGKSFLPYKEIYSGDTAPTVTSAWAIWYDTINNYIKYTNNTGTTWTTIESSLPILTYKANNNIAYGSVTQVFNGMGYIGSHVWVDKGVKGLIPNGRNEDGTLANINAETHNIYMFTFDTTFSGKYIMSLTTDPGHNIATLYCKHSDYVYHQNEKPQGLDKWWFHISENQWKNINDKNEIIKYWWLDVCECTVKNNIITSFKPYVPFKIINNLAKMVQVSTQSIEYTVDANGDSVLPLSVELPGYTAIGFCTYNTMSTNIIPTTLSLGSVRLHNLSSDKISNTFHYKCFFVKDEYL